MRIINEITKTSPSQDDINMLESKQKFQGSFWVALFIEHRNLL
jgi:hypothetical protein